MDTSAPRFEKLAGRSGSGEVGSERLEDHRRELRLMARRVGLDEAELIRLRDVTPAWSTATGQPIGSVPVNPNIAELPAWYPSSAR